MNKFLYQAVTTTAFTLILSLVFQTSYASDDHSNHRGHSDTLLILLQYKIKVTKLQGLYSEALNDNRSSIELSNQLKSNLQQQAKALNRATHLLEDYLAIPETRYPNMDMYHQSLISRGGLLKEFATLLKVFQQQSSPESD